MISDAMLITNKHAEPKSNVVCFPIRETLTDTASAAPTAQRPRLEASLS